MKADDFIFACKEILETIENDKAYEKYYLIISEWLKNYEDNPIYAAIINAHAEELTEILHDKYYSFLQKNALIPRVSDADKWIKRLLVQADFYVHGSSDDVSERIRERKHLEKITDDAER